MLCSIFQSSNLYQPIFLHIICKCINVLHLYKYNIHINTYVYACVFVVLVCEGVYPIFPNFPTHFLSHFLFFPLFNHEPNM